MSVVLATLVLLSATSFVHAATPSFAITLSPRTDYTRYDSPVGVTGARDGTSRLFVVERRGTVRVVKDGVLQSGWFLDLRSVVESGSERGLLGLAFDPDFETNRQLYAYYTRAGGDIVLARFTANTARTHVDRFDQPDPARHRAQQREQPQRRARWPSDRRATCTSASATAAAAAIPENDAQSITRNLLGKVLRLDVHGTGAGPYGRYAIPASNPFAGSTPGLGEIWAYGLRNPWRVTFDRGTARLYIGDVGQDNARGDRS